MHRVGTKSQRVISRYRKRIVGYLYRRLAPKEIEGRHRQDERCKEKRGDNGGGCDEHGERMSDPREGGILVTINEVDPDHVEYQPQDMEWPIRKCVLRRREKAKANAGVEGSQRWLRLLARGPLLKER